MLKCTLRSPKTMNEGIGEKKSFLKKNISFQKTNFISELFFSPNIMSFRTQVEAGKKRMPWLHPE